MPFGIFASPKSDTHIGWKFRFTGRTERGEIAVTNVSDSAVTMPTELKTESD